MTQSHLQNKELIWAYVSKQVRVTTVEGHGSRRQGRKAHISTTVQNREQTAPSDMLPPARLHFLNSATTWYRGSKYLKPRGTLLMQTTRDTKKERMVQGNWKISVAVS